MALLLHRETPPVTAGHDGPALRTPSRTTGGRWWTQRVIAIALWSLLVVGFVMAAVVFARPTSSFQPSSVSPPPSVRWDAAGFAELYVAAFVAAGEGTEGTLTPFLGVAPSSLTGVVPGVWFASRTTTTAVARLDDRRWAVMVAADLLRRDGEADTAPYVAVGVRYFRVELVEADGGLVASSLPAMVASPSPSEPVDDQWPPASPPAVDGPLDDTVARFLAALLTGNGELARYAAPGSQLRAAPATFETVTVDRLAIRGDGDRRRVRAWLTGASGPAAMQLVYDLSLTRRDGRWEVSAVGTSVAIDPAQPAGTAAPSSNANGS